MTQTHPLSPLQADVAHRLHAGFGYVREDLADDAARRTGTWYRLDGEDVVVRGVVRIKATIRVPYTVLGRTYLGPSVEIVERPGYLYTPTEVREIAAAFSAAASVVQDLSKPLPR